MPAYALNVPQRIIQGSPLMQMKNEVIVYTLITNGGGIDGMDHTDKGGKMTHAFLTRGEAERCPNLPWCTINPIVADLRETAKNALAKLTPIERLALKNEKRHA